MAIPVFAAWLAELVAGYATTAFLEWYNSQTEQQRWSALFGEIYEIRQTLAALTGEDSLTACLEPWDLKAAIEDNETGLNAAQISRTNIAAEIMSNDAPGLAYQYSLLRQIFAYVLPGAEEPEPPSPMPAPIVTNVTVDVSMARVLAAIFAASHSVAQLPQTDKTDRVLAAIFATAHQQAATPEPDFTELLARFDMVDTSLSGLASGHGSILDAIAALEPGGGTAGAPVWPGLANVTIGDAVALSNGLRIATPMDGVLISVTTPPSKTGLMDIGGAMFDYREGQLAFETDNGEIETWQYLGFRQAIFTPRTMKRASAVRFRVLAGAEGLIYPWTVT